MTQGVVWANSIGKDDLETVGGKGANLGEMIQAGLPVPPAFVVTAGAFRDFLDESGIGDKIYPLLAELDVDDNKALQEASGSIRKAITDTPVPSALRDEIIESYRNLGDSTGGANPLVAVRSSATAEDLPEASFAGQQDTYLNIRGEDELIDHVRQCWASLFTPRAIFYRVKQDFPHDQVAIAVVVQLMADAKKAGVMFTKHPTTGNDITIIEAAWGLGEGVVSGSVSPDNYELDPEGNLRKHHIAIKGTMHVRGEKDRTVVEKVPPELREARVLPDGDLRRLFQLGRTIENHYGTPQDIEWAIDEEGELYLLQTRPITTIKADAGGVASSDAGEGDNEDQEVLVTGLGAAPGVASGKVAQVHSVDELDKCKAGDILVTVMTTPDMVPAMRRAAAIVTDEGGMTCHAAIVSRELGVPCLVGTRKATQVLTDGKEVTVDADRSQVIEGITKKAKQQAEAAKTPAAPAQAAAAKPLTATQVKVNISMPDAIDRAMATDPDGVGLLRVEHIILGLGKHPLSMIRGGKEDEYVKDLTREIKRVVEPMFPRQVWVRTLDAPTDEFRGMEGSQGEPKEHNPMLGWRGIRRGLDQPDLVKAEFKAIKRLVDEGFTNIGVMLPLVNRPEEIREAKRLMREVGLEPHRDVEFGIMIEIPAAALIIDDLLDEGLDFVSFGTNDLTQYTLAVDRNNENVAGLYSEFHPAISKLIEMTIKACRPRGVQTSICGQAGSDPKFVQKLIDWGITSVSANIDALPRVRETVARTERKILLDRARS